MNTNYREAEIKQKEAKVEPFDALLALHRSKGSWLDKRVYKDEEEYLETPGLPLEIQFDIVDKLSRLNNRSGYTAVFLKLLGSLIEPAVKADPSSKIKILDIGIGGGGLLKAIHHWAQRNKINVELWGLDSSENFILQAKHRLEAAKVPVQLIRGNACDLRQVADESFDFVLCSHMVHHIRSANEVAAFLKEVYRISRRGWLIADFNRTLLGPLFVGVCGTLFGASGVLLTDGIKSMRRAYSAEEMNLILQTLEDSSNIANMVCSPLPVLPYWTIKGRKNAG